MGILTWSNKGGRGEKRLWETEQRWNVITTLRWSEIRLVNEQCTVGLPFANEHVGLHRVPTSRRLTEASDRWGVGWWFSRGRRIMRPWFCSWLFLWTEGSKGTSLPQTMQIFKAQHVALVLQLVLWLGLHFPSDPWHLLLPALYTCLVWYSPRHLFTALYWDATYNVSEILTVQYLQGEKFPMFPSTG